MSYYRHGPYRPTGGLAVPRVTPCVKAIAIACVAVWIAQWLAWLGKLPLEGYLGLVPRAVLGGALWQPFTYMFLHSPGDVLHLLFNMLMLWMFGSELEGSWGSRGFLTFYLVCGLGAGLFITGLGAASAPYAATVGASGAIYGLMMAYGIVFANRTILFMMLFPMRARTMAWIMFLIAFFSTVHAAPSGVSHVAHLGGAITGYLYLKRAWRLGDFYRELRWKLRRRRFTVLPPDEGGDRWVN